MERVTDFCIKIGTGGTCSDAILCAGNFSTAKRCPKNYAVLETPQSAAQSADGCCDELPLRG